MEKFEFHNPTKIIFGIGKSEDLGKVVRTFGNRILLVIGQKSLRKSGWLKKILDNFKQAGVDVSLVEGIRSNPGLAKVKEGIKRAKSNQVQVIVGVGGGSVMDTAKAIAAGVLLENENIWDCFLGRSFVKDALPVITMPTLAASGSEMNGYMVITNEETQHKLACGSPHLFPKVSILDPSLTCSVPSSYTAFGGVDAVCHLLEPYFNGPAKDTQLQDEIAEAIIRVLVDVTQRCLKEPDDLEGRSTMMWAATLALNGLTKAGVGEHCFPVHMMEHAISALFPVAHGQGLGALLPGWMTWKAQTAPQKIVRMGKNVFCSSGDYREAISAFKEWLIKINCASSLAQLGITPDYHEIIADNILMQARIWNVDQIYSKDVLLHILKECQD